MFEEFGLLTGRRPKPFTPTALHVQALEERAVASVSFGYDATRIHTISVDGANLFNPSPTGGGAYLIGSRTGSDGPDNTISVGTNGKALSNGGPDFKLKFWSKGADTLGFRAEVGPVQAGQTDPKTGELKTLSFPFDFRKDAVNQFAFNGSRYYLNGSGRATAYKSGTRVNYADIPTPHVIQFPGGPVLGRVGVAETRRATGWAEASGPLGTVRVSVLKKSHYGSMGFFNHFGTNNIELQFGSFKPGERAAVEGEVKVTPPPARTWLFQTETHAWHQTGVRDGSAWRARAGVDAAGRFLSYGPYTTDITAGARTATFRLAADKTSSSSAVVLTVDVYDAATGKVLARRDITRKEFKSAKKYQDINLGFTAAAGQKLEFRSFWHGGQSVRQDYVSVK